MNIVRDPDVLFVLMWIAGCIITAGLVETIKAGMTKPYKWLWRVLAGTVGSLRMASARRPRSLSGAHPLRDRHFLW